MDYQEQEITCCILLQLSILFSIPIKPFVIHKLYKHYVEKYLWYNIWGITSSYTNVIYKLDTKNEWLLQINSMHHSC